ncbi:MAG: glycosyltransferase family 4 protein [Candidatus Omnitrophota bacterium]
MPKIKVLHIITRLDKGGSAENTLFTVAKLDKERFDTVLVSGITHDPDNQVTDFIRKENINYVLIPELVREIALLKDIKAFFKILNFIRKERFDIVHTHSSKAGMLGRWAAKLAGVKIIIHTPHGHIFYGYFNYFLTQVFIFLEKITAKITDRIITLTKRGKEEHIKYGIACADKLVPVYSGIEIEKFRNYQIDKIKQKKILKADKKTAIIGTVSRLESVKGGVYFISALPEIIKTFPKLKVFIIGGGTEKENLERLTRKLGVAKNVVFMGECQDISWSVSTFDVFVLSSLNEGMGRCLLEAQALGVPVVATRVGGIPEVVKDGVTGFLVPPQNSEAIAEAVIKLLKDDFLREQMSRQARENIDYRFSVEAMVARIAGVYEEMIRRNILG